MSNSLYIFVVRCVKVFEIGRVDNHLGEPPEANAGVCRIPWNFANKNPAEWFPTRLLM